jgi:hypothetical protein
MIERFGWIVSVNSVSFKRFKTLSFALGRFMTGIILSMAYAILLLLIAKRFSHRKIVLVL